MKLIARVGLMIIAVLSSVVANAQPIEVSGKLSTQGISADIKGLYTCSILHHSADGTALYVEKQTLKINSDNSFQILLGTGINAIGSIDSVIWSDGDFFLKISPDSSVQGSSNTSTTIIPLRIETDLNNENIEGMATADTLKSWGKIKIPHNKGRRPKKITADLSTSYVNVAYPGDTYPIYRHFEWFDTDKDGIGNSFELTYSEKSNHAFWQNTRMLGDVKLYQKPFQQLKINQLDGEIELELTSPIEVTNLNVTYGIKGPWKLIYFIEW